MTKKTKLISALLCGSLLTASAITAGLVLTSCNNSNNYQNHIIGINVLSSDLYSALNKKFTADEWKSGTKLINAANQVLDRAAGANKDRINCSFSVKPLIPTSDTSNDGTIKLLVVVEDGFAINIDNDSNVSFDPSSNIITIRKLSLKKSSTSNNIVVNPSKLYNALNLQFDDNDWKTKTKLTNAINKVLDDAAGADKNKVSCSLFGNPIIPSSNTSNDGTIKFKIIVQSGTTISINNANNVSFDPKTNIVTINRLNLKKPGIITININSLNLYNALNLQFDDNEWKVGTQLVNAINQILDKAAGANKDKISCSLFDNPTIPSSDTSNNGTIKFKINTEQGYIVNIDSNNNVLFDASSNVVTINRLNLKKPGIVTININSTVLYNALNAQFTLDQWNARNDLSNAANQVLDDAAGANKNNVSCYIYGNPSNPSNDGSNNGSIKFKINVGEGYAIHIDNTNNVSFDPNSNVVTINGLSIKRPNKTETIDIQRLFNNIASKAANICKVDFNTNSTLLINALNDALNSATNNTLQVTKILSTNVDESSLLATVTFAVNNKLSDFVIENNNNPNVNLDINNNTITINNLKVPRVTHEKVVQAREQYLPGNTYGVIKSRILDVINLIQGNEARKQPDFHPTVTSFSGTLSNFEYTNEGILKMQYVHKKQYDSHDQDIDWNNTWPFSNMNVRPGDSVSSESTFDLNINLVEMWSDVDINTTIRVNSNVVSIPEYQNYWKPSVLNTSRMQLNEHSLKVVIDFLKATGNMFNANYNPETSILSMHSLSQDDKNRVWNLIDGLVQTVPQQTIWPDITGNWSSMGYINIDLDSSNKQIWFYYYVNWGNYANAEDPHKNEWSARYKFEYNSNASNPAWAQQTKFNFRGSDYNIAFSEIVYFANGEIDVTLKHIIDSRKITYNLK